MFLSAVAKRAGAEGRDNHAVIRYLVDIFGPRLLFEPQQKRLSRFERPSLYEGKSPLHQAILSHDVKMVQFFIERGADVHARCIGSFFGATSHAYYGEYPLSFAVCTGQDEVVRYLAENGSKVSEGLGAHCCCCKLVGHGRHRRAADSKIMDLGHACPLGDAFSLPFCSLFHAFPLVARPLACAGERGPRRPLQLRAAHGRHVRPHRQCAHGEGRPRGRWGLSQRCCIC